MNINYKIPFYTNTEDNIHCVQASMKMVYEYFVPDVQLSFDKWDKITCHKPELWTWSMAGLIWFKKNNFDVIDIEAFDYKKFSIEGKRYLLDFAGEEVGSAQIKYSDIEQEIKIAKDFIKEVKIELRAPTIKDIRFYLEKGYLVICGVNACVLEGNDGYSGHAIVVKGITDSGLIINDPGLPAKQDLEITDEIFNKAWRYPDEKATNMCAIKLKS